MIWELKFKCYALWLFLLGIYIISSGSLAIFFESRCNFCDRDQIINNVDKYKIKSRSKHTLKNPIELVQQSFRNMLSFTPIYLNI